MSDKVVEILIVEDSPTQAQQLKYFLEQHDFNVFLAANGKEALSLLGTHKPDIIISDIVMAEINGYEFCKMVKSNETLKDIPVILLTVLSGPVNIISGLECGADYFVIKPYEEKHLISKIEHIINHEPCRQEGLQRGAEIIFRGTKYFINSERKQILELLMSTYEDAFQKNLQLVKVQKELLILNEQLEQKVREKTATLVTEIEERKIAEQTLRKLHQQNEAILNSAGEGIIGLDKEGRHTFVNTAARRMLGYSIEELIGKRFHEMWHHTRPDGSPNPVEESLIYSTLKNGLVYIQTSDVIWRKDGTGFPVEYTSTPLIEKEKLVGAVIVFRDISETIKLRDKLEKLSITDELTGLHNRRGFLTLATQQLKLARQRTNQSMLLIYVDMDNMKMINDKFGHQEGDKALINLANILTATFRTTDIIARLGGDEFAVLAIDTCEKDVITKRLLDNIENHNSNKEVKYLLSVSIGIVCSDQSDALSIEEMLSQADKMMYRKKKVKM